MPAAPEVVQDSPSEVFLSGIAKSSKFTSAFRLLRKDGFDRIVQAENISDRYIKVFFARNGKENARLGIIASKKILPRAIDRNRFKRSIRQAFRLHRIKFQKLDIVVMVRHACAQQRSFPGGNLEVLFSRVENRCVES